MEQAMNTTRVFIATIVISVAVIAVAVVVILYFGPAKMVSRATDYEVRASGRCLECHIRETPGIADQFLNSKHSDSITCLDCHQPNDAFENLDHNGFVIQTEVTSGVCSSCHLEQYRQFIRSRHGAPSWDAVWGSVDFSEEQMTDFRLWFPDFFDRDPNVLASLEGMSATESGCMGCHSIGQPNADGSVGVCRKCHLRHDFSLQVARTSTTCGACHMGPDHSQVEIWTESPHGVFFYAKKEEMDLTVSSDELTVEHQPAPTCSTCHMSGLGKASVTHNVGERLTYYLFAAISNLREGAEGNKERMMQICSNCHAQSHIDRFYADAEQVVLDTNARVGEIKELMDGLYDAGKLTPELFDEKLEFDYFDYWHYFGRTAKHGAYMGGPDFVQWHGNYELLLRGVEMKEDIAALMGGI